jgi:hypothetical protein
MAHSIKLNKQYGTDSEVNLNSSPNITSHTPETYEISLIFLKVAIVIFFYNIVGSCKIVLCHTTLCHNRDVHN